ncbi:glycosyltransferase family 25 protein [Euzebya tangerina]|uniref:glycosyltransferase family 25 protein n=1 Tax=Euzebya tangerina TaxID=591198 RepID=UPI000E31031E|nr:glycosyltransferase family 25 protein [Euzebya tangerina]
MAQDQTARPAGDRGTKVVVLSLPTATERRRRFEASVPTCSLPWSFFDAHTGLDPALTYDDRAARRAKGRSLTAGEIGCYSSHLGIWRQLLAGEDQAYIVLEDDVIADWLFLRALADHRPVDHGISYLRLYYKRTPRYVERQRPFLTRSTALIELLDPAFGTQAYYIARPAARHFLARFSTVSRPIDDQLDRYWEHGVPNYSVFPFPVLETVQESMIGHQRFEEPAAPVPASARLAGYLDRTRKRMALRRRRAGTSVRGRVWGR